MAFLVLTGLTGQKREGFLAIQLLNRWFWDSGRTDVRCMPLDPRTPFARLKVSIFWTQTVDTLMSK